MFDKKTMISFEEYCNFNKNVSSEMFYSIMSVLHERLPCAQNFFRLKKIYRAKIVNTRKCQSPSRKIASPSMFKV